MRPRFRLEERPPGSLVPNPANFRRHPEAQKLALQASIDEHGWLAAPLLNERTGHLLDGHARVEMALAEGEATLPVSVIDVSPAQERRILRSLDRITEMAEIDTGALDALIESIDDAALEQLLAEVAATPSGLLPEADPDALPEVVETRCKAGDLWQLGEHRLLCGDSAKGEDVERLMIGKRASLLVTDPPYAVDYAGTAHPDRERKRGAMGGTVRNKDWADTYVEASAHEMLEERFLMVALSQALAEHSAIYEWYADKRIVAILPAWEKLGLHLHQIVYWVKQPVLTFSHFMGAVESCLYGWVEGRAPVLEPPNNATTAWDVAREGRVGALSVHPTQKPVELFSRPIEWHTHPAEIVYEPFAGSGTQVIAAEQLGRACYALEISPEFCDVILARWEQATGKSAEKI